MEEANVQVEKDSQKSGGKSFSSYKSSDASQFYLIVQPVRFSLNENSASLMAIVMNTSARANIEKVLKVPCRIKISPFYSNASTELIGSIKSFNAKNLKTKGVVCYVITINFDYKDNEAKRISYIASKFLPPFGSPGGSRDYGLNRTKLEFFAAKVENKEQKRPKKRRKTKRKVK